MIHSRLPHSRPTRTQPSIGSSLFQNTEATRQIGAEQEARFHNAHGPSFLLTHLSTEINFRFRSRIFAKTPWRAAWSGRVPDRTLSPGGPLVMSKPSNQFDQSLG